MKFWGRVVQVDFEENAIETASAQSPIKHSVKCFGYL